jgi:hypothetical protein
VRKLTASFVAVPVHRAVRFSSPEFVGRAAASTGRSAATPSLPPPLAASSSRTLRLGASCALNRGLELEIEFAGEVTAPRRRKPARRRLLPRRQPLTCVPGRRIVIQWPRFNLAATA